jgi:hypothetical protein
VNELIHEFARQAGIHPESDTLCRYEGGSAPMEKFAELIVKKCLRICDRRGAYEVMDDIIDYFGVDPWL